MYTNNFLKVAARCVLLVLCLSIVSQPTAIFGQDPKNTEQLRQKAEKLMKELNYVAALPILEKLLLAEPNDPDIHFKIGFALLGQAKVSKDEADRKALRIRARNEFIKSKELGNKAAIVDALIQDMSPDGSEGAEVSRNNEANKIMNAAEAAYSSGKLDDALDKYQKALELDPKLYEAALFSGDVHTQRGDYKKAEIWYQKAIAIDPNRETAYRYSATPLMKQKKYDEARDRYIEAYIAEPYSRFSIAGMTQWAEVTGTSLAHPSIDIPTSVTVDDKGDVKINLDASLLMAGKDDGSFAWLTYGGTRKTWIKEKFAKAFPQEKAYRHSLAEEAEALRSVVTIATSDKKVKTLSPSIARLKKLNDENLLEAYILLVRADKGIAQDFPVYLAQNRDKLRRYVVEYVVTGGGK